MADVENPPVLAVTPDHRRFRRPGIPILPLCSRAHGGSGPLCRWARGGDPGHRLRSLVLLRVPQLMYIWEFHRGTPR
jgi:hypothetical protein